MVYSGTNKEGKILLRFAANEDVMLILELIKEMAEYEDLSGEVEATEDLLRESLFEKKSAEVIIADYNGEPAGYALFFQSFSTFLAKPGIYMEDLFVKFRFRGKGIGKAMMSFLAKIAHERGCARLEWSCLDWNESSIRFYKKLGGLPMAGWTTYRMSSLDIEELAHKKPQE